MAIRERGRWGVRGAGGTILLFALWLAFVTSVQVQELVLGAIACAALLALAAVVRTGPARTRAGAADVLVPLGHSLLRLPPDTAALVTILWRRAVRGRPPPGRFATVRAPVGGHDGRAVARRTAATVAASLAPGSYVVDASEDGWILVHQLRPEDRTGIRGGRPA